MVELGGRLGVPWQQLKKPIAGLLVAKEIRRCWKLHRLTREMIDDR